MFTWLLGFGLIKAAVNIAATILDIVSPIIKAAIELVIFIIKKFFEGLGVCLGNLSTLTVIVTAIIFGGWYFQTWDNAKVLKKCNAEITRLHTLIPKPVVPVKKVTTKNIKSR